MTTDDVKPDFVVSPLAAGTASNHDTQLLLAATHPASDLPSQKGPARRRLGWVDPYTNTRGDRVVYLAANGEEWTYEDVVNHAG